MDYSKSFDMVDHHLLMEKLKVYVVDSDSLSWFKSYLSYRQQLVSLAGNQSNVINMKYGVPQGNILGPLLFIIFINDLPLNLSNARIDLYADDATITSSSEYNEISKLQESLNNAIIEVSDWAISNKLPLNEKKTKSIFITGKRLKSRIEDVPTISRINNNLTNVSSAKLLGLEIDEELTSGEHFDQLCMKLSQRIAVLRKITDLLPLKQRILYYNSMIKPIMSYISVIWTQCDHGSLGRVLKLQKRAARVILNEDLRTPSVELFNRFKWSPFYEDAKISKCSLAYKKVHGQVPTYISNMLKSNSEGHTRRTRYYICNFLCPKYQHETEGGRTFAVSVSKLWNSLPLELRQLNSLRIFKKSLWNKIFNEQKLLHHFIV